MFQTHVTYPNIVSRRSLFVCVFLCNFRDNARRNYPASRYVNHTFISNRPLHQCEGEHPTRVSPFGAFNASFLAPLVLDLGAFAIVSLIINRGSAPGHIMAYRQFMQKALTGSTQDTVFSNLSVDPLKPTVAIWVLRVWFYGRDFRVVLFPVRSNSRWRPAAILENVEWAIIFSATGHLVHFMFGVGFWVC